MGAAGSKDSFHEGYVNGIYIMPDGRLALYQP
jgi:hypothetical protein